MPLYSYLCPTCADKVTIFKKIADLERDEFHDCGMQMTRVLEAPFVRGDYEAYTCPITGNLIEGKVAHNNNLKKHGCRLWEPGETDRVIAERARREADEDAALERSIDEEIAKLPSEKRERLGAEMENGLTAEVVRTSL